MADTAVRTSYVDLTISSDEEPPISLVRRQPLHAANGPSETVDISSDDEVSNLMEWQARKGRATPQIVPAPVLPPVPVQERTAPIKPITPNGSAQAPSSLETSGQQPTLKRTRDGEFKAVNGTPRRSSELSLSPQTGPLVCPYPSCERNRPEAAYKRGWMLKEHVERVHHQENKILPSNALPPSIPLRNGATTTTHANGVQTPLRPPEPESIPQVLPRLAHIEMPQGLSSPAQSQVEKLVADMEQSLNDEALSTNRHYRKAEDKLIIYLKETRMLGWMDIYKYFPHRQGKNLLECRYSAVLKKRRAPWQSSENYKTPRTPLIDKVRSATPSSSTETPPPEPGSWSTRNRRSWRRGRTKVSYSKYYPEALVDFVSSDSEESTTLDLERGILVKRSSSKPDLDFTRLTRERDRDATLVASLSSTILRPPTVVRGSKPISDPTLRITVQKRPSLAIQRPYLRARERDFVRNLALWQKEALSKWSGSILHVGFNDQEIEYLLRHASQSLNLNALALEGSPKDRLLTCLKEHSKQQLVKSIFLQEARRWELNRATYSVSRFLEDLENDEADSKDIIWIVPSTTARSERPQATIGNLIRERELGQRRSATSQLETSCLGLHATFHGTSGDAHALAWSPNGDYFAVGSTAITDSHSMQYNMACNLLFGSADDLSLLELPQHAIKRETPMTGSNSLPSMRATQEPFLFTSVSSMAFSPDGQRMYSAGYDERLRLWNIQQGATAREIDNVQHAGPLDVLTVGRAGLVATGAKTSGEPIRIFENDLHQVASLSSKYSGEAKSANIFPTALAFGDTFDYLNKYLLCGFSSHDREYGSGDAAILDIERNTPHWIKCRSVFDATWSPCTFGRFAIASVAGVQANRGIKSVVRVFDSRYIVAGNSLKVNGHRTVELECPALDINDTRFNPRDAYLISTGCTNGSAYTWDIRKSGKLLHCFSHGPSLMPLDETRRPEEVDTGLRFLSWSKDGRQLYTGSSDGVVSVWDPYQSTDDCFVKDVVKLKSGVMSGSFSPDYSKLLLGEVNSGFSMLSLGRALEHDDEREKLHTFSLNRATAETGILREVFATPSIDGESTDESGIKISQKLVESNQISIRPCGGYPFLQAVQGPNYSGPFSTSSDADVLRSSAETFQAGLISQDTSHTLREEVPKATEEEFGDMGLWKARIPGMRRQQLTSMEESIKCFRCSTTNLSSIPSIKSDSNILQCHQCNLGWQANILGYTFLGSVDLDGKERLPSYIDQATQAMNDDNDDDVGGTEKEDIDFCHDYW